MQYDLIVIGGGPAGMMAAGRAAEKGARVLLLEGKRSLGNKLLITGNGRCNITNSIDDPRIFAEKMGGDGGKFLLSALTRFGAAEIVDFFNSRGVETVVEDNGKVFPQSSSSREVLDALISYLEEYKVEVMENSKAVSFEINEGHINKVSLNDGRDLEANGFIVATGGKSYPLTGSTGEMYDIIASLGHTIIEPRPILSAIEVEEKFIKDIEGVSLSDVELSAYADNNKIGSESGEIIFTGKGISGPAAINFSRSIDTFLFTEGSRGALEIRLDLLPSLDFSQLDDRLEKDFQEESNRMIKNYLSDLVPSRLASLILSLAKVGEEKRCNEMTRDSRKAIAHVLKEMSFTFKTLSGFDRAMVTRGGVSIKEIDPKTMRSKLVDNLHFAGEVLDLDGPTGGFNLQIAWSTGFVAGVTAF